MTKDLSSKQYEKAATKQGFKRTLFGLKDTSGMTPGVIYGSVLDGNMQVRKRTTLANAIESRRIRSKS